MAISQRAVGATELEHLSFAERFLFAEPVTWVSSLGRFLTISLRYRWDNLIHPIPCLSDGKVLPPSRSEARRLDAVVRGSPRLIPNAVPGTRQEEKIT